eukprot:tig00020780_g13785.t1
MLFTIPFHRAPAPDTAPPQAGPRAAPPGASTCSITSASDSSSIVAQACTWTPPTEAKAARTALYESPDRSVVVETDFDSGNGRVVRTQVLGPDAECVIWIEIEPDTNSRDYQWFHVRVRCAPGRRLRLIFTNAPAASYPRGWQGYRAYWSAGAAVEDSDAWETAETTYDPSEGLAVRVVPRSDETDVALFVPYSLAQVDALVRRAAESRRCSATVIGASVEGRAITELRFGEGRAGAGSSFSRRKHLWVIARQHPGEAMASFFVEGLVSRLLASDAGAEDAEVERLLARADVHVVPLMNPDGVFWGNHRNNAAGIDLNRQWNTPDPERAPEVACVRKRMEETGCHFFLDAHGDEGLPYVFVAGSEGVPSFGPRVADLQDRFKALYSSVNPSFQDEYNYGRRAPGRANLGIATSSVGERHRCLAFTLEMPFLACRRDPDPLHGFGAPRARRLGAALPAVLSSLVDDL